MGLLSKLTTQGSIFSRNNGGNISVPNHKDSKLHNKYSITGDPNQPFKPSPSQLDMNGEIPSNNYRDNVPEGKSF